MGGVLTFSLVSSFLTMFYTDILHFTSTSIMMLMLVARIWDAVNDPLWGAFIDSRKPTRFGRFATLHSGCLFTACVKRFYDVFKNTGSYKHPVSDICICNLYFYGMMYTGVNIPYGSLASVITSDEIERSSLSMWRSVGAGLGGLPAQILLPLVVYSTVTNADGTTAKILDSGKLSIAVACLSILTLIVFFSHFKMTKERVSILPNQQQK